MSSIDDWLNDFVKANGGVAGTVHVREGEDLVLASALRIPEKVRALVGRIPRGKGMAGLAFERQAPVHTCNLATDTSGDVRPGARAVDAQAAVALPIFDEAGAVRGVVGIAYADEKTLEQGELERLSAAANECPTKS
jgi:hypothetical protein